jgi:hypothetical protein
LGDEGYGRGCRRFEGKVPAMGRGVWDDEDVTRADEIAMEGRGERRAERLDAE